MNRTLVSYSKSPSWIQGPRNQMEWGKSTEEVQEMVCIRELQPHVPRLQTARCENLEVLPFEGHREIH